MKDSFLSSLEAWLYKLLYTTEDKPVLLYVIKVKAGQKFFHEHDKTVKTKTPT